MDNKLFKIIGETVKSAEKNGDDLTSKNLKYVAKVAKDVASKTGADVSDLFAEGVIAMKKCEEKYDPEKNDNFVKFCATSVRGYMMNFVNRQSSLVHIPVNHLKGFKSGQESRDEVSEISYNYIDSMDYDSLGIIDDNVFNRDKFEILMEGLNTLDENARIAIKMKLRIDEYSHLKKNSMKVIADELEVPVNIANKIYKEALQKLTKYCRAEING